MELLGWPLGILLSALASILGILGKIMIKISYRRQLELDESCWWWWGGMALIVIINPSLCISAYNFAPQSLLAPMGGLCVVWNTILSPRILNEELRTRDIVGALLIFLGCVVVGISGGHETHAIPIHDLGSHFLSIQFLVYLILYCMLTILLVHNAWPALQYRRRNFNNTLMISNNEHESVTCRVSLAILAGSLSGQLYCMTSLLRLASNGAKVIFSSPLAYIVGAGALIFAFSGLYLLNIALQLYEALFVIYIYESTLIAVGAISGICFFGDMFTLSLWHLIMYGVGVGSIFVGISVISHGNQSQSRERNDDFTAVKQTLL